MDSETQTNGANTMNTDKNMTDAEQIYHAMNSMGQTVDVFNDELDSVRFHLEGAANCMEAARLYPDAEDVADAKAMAVEGFEDALKAAELAEDATQDAAEKKIARDAGLMVQAARKIANV